MTATRQAGPSVAVFAVLAVLAGAGCTTSSAIHLSELKRLDGYPSGAAAAPSPPELETLSGDRVAFTPKSDLYLDLPEGSVGGRFASIRVREAMFEGRTTDGATIQAPLERIRNARVDNPHPAVVGVVAGGVMLAVIVGGFFLVFNSATGSAGRPLRIGRRATVAVPEPSSGWSVELASPDLASISPQARAALASAWLESARGEHASVPAFARLSLTLVALGAPSRLVERAHRAALEEVEHARLSFALASAYRGQPVSAGPISELRRARAVTVTTIRELAEESLVEGCLLEGTAAAVAEAALARASDPAVRGVLQGIARDEASHVELAWAIVRWCCEQSHPALVDRLTVLAVRQRAARAPFEAPGSLAEEMAAHGCLGAEDWRAAHERTRLGALARLAQYARTGNAPSTAS